MRIILNRNHATSRAGLLPGRSWAPPPPVGPRLHAGEAVPAPAPVNGIQRLLKRPFTPMTGRALRPCPVGPIIPLRAAHRAGTPARINHDAEMPTFIRARIDRMTFAQIATLVADHVPPERRVGNSAIHAWFRRNVPRDSGGR